MPRPPAESLAPPAGGPGQPLASRARMPAVQPEEPGPPVTVVRLASGHHLRVVRPAPAHLVQTIARALGSGITLLRVTVIDPGRNAVERPMLLALAHIEAIEGTADDLGFPPDWTGDPLGLAEPGTDNGEG